ncbi:MAG: STAS/SEC14 domain-containing protein [Planctomycetota bacterium]
MTVAIQPLADGQTLMVHLSGKLRQDDYQAIRPQVERLLAERDAINVVVDTEGFTGWSPGALWEDIKLDVKHRNDLGRVAVIGERQWHQGMATFCRLFTQAEVRFFEPQEREDARAWAVGGEAGDEVAG